jgi:hypothetical protein
VNESGARAPDGKTRKDWSVRGESPLPPTHGPIGGVLLANVCVACSIRILDIQCNVPVDVRAFKMMFYVGHLLTSVVDYLEGLQNKLALNIGGLESKRW